MAAWPRIVRGMIGTGLVFGAGIGGAALVVGLAAMVFGEASLGDLRMAARVSVVGFLVGVGFSGILAITARNKRFSELSIPRFAGLGAGAGLLYFLFIAINASHVWSLGAAIGNLVLLTAMGSLAATGTIVVARKARPELGSADNTKFLGEG
jgi:hypothetical protein